MKARRAAIACAVALLAALLPLLAGGAAGREAAAAQNGGSITLPVQTYAGYVVAVTKSDLPRFELVAPVRPTELRPGRPPACGAARYVLLAPASTIAPLKTAATPDARGLYVPVRIEGAPVAIPGLTRMSPAIVVQKAELLLRTGK